MRHLNSFLATESSEHCTIHKITVWVNCEAIVFRVDEGWIVQETIIFIFNFYNICIQFVKRSGSKTTNYLIHLLIFQPGCMFSWELGVCPERVSFKILFLGKKRL